MISLQGPLSKSLLESILQETGSRLPDPGKNNERQASIAGTSVEVGRTGYTGEPLGFEIFCPADRAVAIWEKSFTMAPARGLTP